MYARNVSFQVMRFKMSDSDSRVNTQRNNFDFVNHLAANPMGMASNRDDVVSSYVRHRIREWRDSGVELKALAAKAGFAKSTPSQVLLGTGVGAKTGPRFARAFGFSSYEAMRQAAWQWWQEQTAAEDLQPLSQTEPMLRASKAVLALGQGTVGQVETILRAYAHERFRSRDEAWWLQTILAELERDRMAIRGETVAPAATPEAAPKAAPPKISARRRSGTG